MESDETPKDGVVVSAELLQAVTGNGEFADNDQKPLEVIVRFKSEDSLEDAWGKLGGVSGQSDEDDSPTHVLKNLTLEDIHSAILATSEMSDAFDKALGEATVEQMDMPVEARAAFHRQEVKGVEVPEVHKVSFDELSSISCVLTPADVRALESMASSNPEFAQKLPFDRIEPVLEYEETNEMSAQQIGVNPVLWNLGIDGSGIRVAVIDSGADQNHRDLTGKIGDYKDFSPGVEGGLDATSGHGTHVAGTILGSGAASGGRFRGMAPGAQLYGVKVLEKGTGKTQTIAKGVVYAARKGVDVINMSLGSIRPNNGKDLLSQIVDKVVKEYGIVVCVAAGNAGRNPTSPGKRRSQSIGSPGASREAITVGAVNVRDQVADFSSIGPVVVSSNLSDPQNFKPDVCAPGVDIISVRAHDTPEIASPKHDGKPGIPPELQDTYTIKSGTSMATPVTAGVCALLLQAYKKSRRIYDDNEWASLKKKKDSQGRNVAQMLKQVLMSTALRLPGENAFVQGRGRIQPIQAYRVISGVSVPPIPTGPSPLPQETIDIQNIIDRLEQENQLTLPLSQKQELDRLHTRIIQVLTYLQNLRRLSAADMASAEQGTSKLVTRLLAEIDSLGLPRAAEAQATPAEEVTA